MLPIRCFLRIVRQKILDEKLWYPLLCIHFSDNFSIPEIFRNTEVYRHWDTKKNSTENLVSSAPLLSINCFDTGSFVKQRRDPLRSFSVIEDNKFCIENLYIPPLGIKFLDTRRFLKHRRVPRRYFLPLWDEIFSTEKRDTLLHKVQKSVFELMFVRALWNLI